MIRNLIADNPNLLENALRMLKYSALTKDEMHFNNQQVMQWIKRRVSKEHRRDASRSADDGQSDGKPARWGLMDLNH